MVVTAPQYIGKDAAWAKKKRGTRDLNLNREDKRVNQEKEKKEDYQVSEAQARDGYSLLRNLLRSK